MGKKPAGLSEQLGMLDTPGIQPSSAIGADGHRERMRTRVLTGGGDALADYELLEMVLFIALPRVDTKALAKILLASTNPGDLILDPFLGSGTTAVVAQKLGRCFLGVETVEDYALLAAYRLELARRDSNIQGYVDGVFWERNSTNMQGASRAVTTPMEDIFR